MTSLKAIRGRTYRARPLIFALCVLLCLSCLGFCYFLIRCDRDMQSWPHYVGLLAVAPGEQLNTIGLDGIQNTTPLSFGAPAEAMWRKHPHLVVLGILSTDKEGHRALRDYQRETWFTFPNVARGANGFEGLLLPLYVAGLTGLVPPYISPEMSREVRSWGDTLLLRIYEEPQTQRKRIGEWGSYGLGLHVSNSRKVLLWTRYVYHAFPNTPYFAKGDNDIFLYVPEYLRAVQQLPRMATLYGRVIEEPPKEVPYMQGMLYTCSRDLAVNLMELPLATTYTALPFSPERSDEYVLHHFDHEDWMFSYVLFKHYAQGLRRLPDGWERRDFNAPADVPPPVGWGKLFGDYLRSPSTVLRAGVVPDLGDDTPPATYVFPKNVDPARIVIVTDEDRFDDLSPVRACQSQIVSHHVVDRDMFHALLHSTVSGSECVAYPTSYNVTKGPLNLPGFYYKVYLSADTPRRR